MSAPHRRRGWIFRAAVALAMIAFVGGGVVAYLGYRETAGPNGAVKGYFAALRRGDAASALAFGNLPAGPHTLLTGKVLHEQQRLGPIRHFAITGTKRHGDHANVDVRYTIEFPGRPDQIADSVEVVREGHSWKLAAVAIRTRIGLAEAEDRAALVGAVLPDDEMLLFPGAAPVRLDTPYLQLDPPSAVITFASGVDTSINAVASPLGEREAKAAVITALRTCLKAGADPRCPLPNLRAVPASLRGSLPSDVAEKLTVSLGPDPVGRIEVRGTVSVKGSYTILDFDNVASVRHGRITLNVKASTVAYGALSVTWSQASP